MKTRTRVVGALALAIAAVSCAALFDDAAQCTTDADCARFGAVCDVAGKVCVARSASPDGAAEDVFVAPVDAPAEAIVDDRCALANKPMETIAAAAFDAGDEAGLAGEITGAVTLGCSKDWLLRGRVFVRAGATLTIEPGTRIFADKATNAGLVILPGARIVASGTADRPVVFTSTEAQPAPGDWRGVAILGVAPAGGAARIYQDDPALPYGGVNDDDDSGVLKFVRIEYGALGLVFGGVGRRTVVDSVEVRKSTDNCFTFAGGSVDARHLVCQFPLDEELEVLEGYTGRIQFFFGQKTPLGTAGHHGLLSDAANAQIYNATFCGDSATNLGYGLVARRGTELDLNNVVVMGWTAGVDTVNPVTAAIELRGAIAFANTANPAYAEDAAVTDTTSALFDDDDGFDERAWFAEAARNNRTVDPQLAACFDAAQPRPWPPVPITAGARTPPADGFFDTSAVFVGAFRDANDGWMRGAWVRFAEN